MTEQTQNENGSPQTVGSESWDGFLDEIGIKAESFFHLAGKALEDMTGLMLVRADEQMREKLDMLVESGAAKTRAEALKFLFLAGMEKKKKLFEQIDTTRSQIEALKNQLRDLVGQS